MAGSLRDRRSGGDRRHPACQGDAVASPVCSAAQPKERRAADRRQFPAPATAAALSEAARRVQAAIDEYKLQKGLVRISADELVGILTKLGYHEA
jgi:hypothetical protein